MIKIRRADERGHADYGWLDTYHTFSFNTYYDERFMGFRSLRVINEDKVLAGQGFGTHGHSNMEIISYVVSGALAHKDSTGGEGIIEAGDVQIMSAGTGVRHSEFNASATEAVNLFQCWVFPKVENIQPRYDQRKFQLADRQGKWQVVVSPIEADKALWINQDARFLLTHIKAGHTQAYSNAFAGNGVYIMVIKGRVTINGTELNDRDALGVWEADSFDITANTDAELLAIEVPMF